MRVECTTFHQFCEELEAECNDSESKIHRGLVRIRKDEDQPNPDTGNYQIGYWLTALVENKQAGMFALELGMPLGLYIPHEGNRPEDYEYPDEEFDRIKEVITHICTKHDLSIRDGKWEIY